MSDGRGRYGAVSVTTTATKILSAKVSRSKGLVQALTCDVYVGFDSSVTTSNGVFVPSGSSWSDESPGCWSGDIYAICAAGTVDVRYQEVG